MRDQCLEMVLSNPLAETMPAFGCRYFGRSVGQCALQPPPEFIFPIISVRFVRRYDWLKIFHETNMIEPQQLWVVEGRW